MKRPYIFMCPPKFHLSVCLFVFSSLPSDIENVWSVIGHCSYADTFTCNLLTPNSDQHLISPYNIIPESNIKVMRVKEMITNEALDC